MVTAYAAALDGCHYRRRPCRVWRNHASYREKIHWRTPYILGISSGASLGATVAILFGVGVMFGENFVGVMAFIGAMAISFGVLFISNLGGRPNSVKLILGGLALSAVCSSFSSFVVYLADDKEGIQTITYWLMGSFAGG